MDLTLTTRPIAVQTPETLLGLRLMMTILPLIVLAVVLVLFGKKFVLTDSRVEEIGRELRARGDGNG